MGRRKPSRKKPEEEYTDFGIRVERYEAEADASINLDAYYPQHAINLDDRDPLYRFITRLPSPARQSIQRTAPEISMS